MAAASIKPSPVLEDAHGDTRRNFQIFQILRIAALVIALFGTIGRIIFSSSRDGNVNVLGYFTVQSNIMVVAYLMVETIHRFMPGPKQALQKYPFFSPGVHGALVLYIAITGLIYNTLLVSSHTAEGFNKLLTFINHTLTPLIFIADWYCNGEWGGYRWGYLPKWLLYPIGYGIWGSVEGAATGNFRYFFLNFHRPLGEYLFTMAIVVVAFTAVGTILILVNRWIAPPFNGQRRYS